MKVSQEGLTRADLCRALRRMGVRVTPDQVERWHKAGLVDPPIRTHLGRGMGTASHYPRIAALQAAVVAWLHTECRDLDRIGWYLWCLGFPPTARARKFLMAYVKREWRRAREAMASFERGNPDNPIDRAATTRRLPSGQSGMRRAVGRAEYPFLVRLWTELDLGRGDAAAGIGADDIPAFLKLLAHFRGGGPTKPQTNTKGVAEAAHAIRGLLGDLGRDINLQRTLAALRRVSDTDLDRVRDELQTLVPHFAVRGGSTQEEVLAPPALFIWYFQGRYVSDTLRDGVAEALQNAAARQTIPPPRAPLLRRVVLRLGHRPAGVGGGRAPL